MKPHLSESPLTGPLGIARAYASVETAVLGTSTKTEILIFRVGMEQFGTRLEDVEEVVDLPVIHFVPEMPPAMLGVVALRESLTPVYSPAEALAVTPSSGNAVLIFHQDGAHTGILVDDVDDAVSVNPHDVRASPVSVGDASVVTGVVQHGNALVSIVDADALIASCRASAPTRVR